MKSQVEQIHSQAVVDFKKECAELTQLIQKSDQVKIRRMTLTKEAETKLLKDKIEALRRSESILKGKLKFL